MNLGRLEELAPRSEASLRSANAHFVRQVFAHLCGPGAWQPVPREAWLDACVYLMLTNPRTRLDKPVREKAETTLHYALRDHVVSETDGFLSYVRKKDRR